MSRPHRHRAQGIATIEFAAIFLVAVLIMQVCWWAGRAYWQRTVFEAATRDAARLIATTPPGELGSSTAFHTAVGHASSMLEEAARNSGIEFVGLGISCDGRLICSSAAGLNIIRMEAEANLPETVFPVFGGDGLSIIVAVEVPYDGRFAFQ